MTKAFLYKSILMDMKYIKMYFVTSITESKEGGPLKEWGFYVVEVKLLSV